MGKPVKFVRAVLVPVRPGEERQGGGFVDEEHFDLGHDLLLLGDIGGQGELLEQFIRIRADITQEVFIGGLAHGLDGHFAHLAAIEVVRGGPARTEAERPLELALGDRIGPGVLFGGLSR